MAQSVQPLTRPVFPTPQPVIQEPSSLPSAVNTPFPTFRGDYLYIASWNSITAQRIDVKATLVGPDGKLTRFFQPHFPNTNRTQKIEAWPLIAYGGIRSVIVDPSLSTRRGQTYVQVGILQDPVFSSGSVISSGNAFARFISSYLESYVGWPPGAFESSVSGDGLSTNTRTSSTALAAAGVNFGPPSNAQWRIKNIIVKLITSATVGTRTILVYLTDGTANPSSGVQGTNVLAEFVNSGTFGTGRNVAASTTERYQIGTLGTGTGQGMTLNFALANPLLLSDLQRLWIQDKAAIDVSGDAVTVDFLLEEFLETF